MFTKRKIKATQEANAIGSKIFDSLVIFLLLIWDGKVLTFYNRSMFISGTSIKAIY